MDISLSSRPHFSAPTSPSEESKISLAASNTVYTYHCLCTHLLIATTTPLPSLPTRQNSLDKAHIMPLPPPPPPSALKSPSSKDEMKAPNDHYGLLLSTMLARQPEMLCTDAGFEKRYLQKCGRCNLTVGYQLDWAQFEDEKKTGRREDVVFLLPGGLITTREMIMGKAAGIGAKKFGVGVTEMVTEVEA